MVSNVDTPVIAQSEGEIESVSPSKRRKLFSLMDKSHITNKTRTAYHCSHDYLAAVELFTVKNKLRKAPWCTGKIIIWHI